MVFRDSELKYDHSELHRGQGQMIKVTKRKKTARNVSIIYNTGFFLGDKFNGNIFFDI